MSLVPYALSRALLFRLDAERAHEWTLAMLRQGHATPLVYAWSAPRVDDPIQLAGLTFPNRIGLAAGLDKNAGAIDGLVAMGFGFIEVGTVTPKPQPGNPKPRLFRLPQAQALINRMGFNNDGLDAFVANVKRSRLHQDPPRSPRPLLGLNIGKNATTPMEHAVDDYLTGLAGVYPWADYITVNISSPNTKNLRELQSDAAIDGLLSALKSRQAELADQHGKHVPLFLKIAPDLNDIQIGIIAQALLHHAMDGVIATNTTLARDAVQGLRHAEESGGLSGVPVRDASNHVIRNLRAALGARFPIVGVGGISSGADAVDKIDAGADVVQVYTGLIYRGPGLVNEVALALRARSRPHPNGNA